MSGDQLAPDEPCPECGRTDPRAAVAAFTTRVKARSQLLREAHALGLDGAQTAELVTGIRTFPAPPTREDTL